jgi:hypothetical protein
LARAATVLGGLVGVILAAAIALEAYEPGTLSVSQASGPLGDATGVALVLAFAAVGVIVARRQPRNPIGWLLLAGALLWEVGSYSPAYLDLDYLVHRGRLPFGHVALLLSPAAAWALLTFPLIVLLFPDGHLGRRWRWPLRAYLLVYLADIASSLVQPIADFSLATPVDRSGSVIGANQPSGGQAWAGSVQGFALLVLFVFSLAAVIHQVRVYRAASGDRRQQLKWLGIGEAVCVVVLPTFVWSSAPAVLADLLPLALTAVPVTIGMGILRYRLYEVDRLISRTLSYAILTALLVGAFVGLVALSTNTLALSGRVGVAASTLAAAALFNPLRVRVQRLVDRSFNRARYDAETIVAGFTARLRDAVEIDTIRSDLLDVVASAVQPSHVTLWIRDLARSPRPPAPRSAPDPPRPGAPPAAGT